MKLVTAMIFTIFSLPVLAEKITYEIYEAATGQLVASGVKEYTTKDLILNPYENNGKHVVEKLIDLEQGYKIGARLFQESKLTGFGLIAKKTPKDFSWEWYDLNSGSTFKKRQGGTYVKVKTSGLPIIEMLEEVVFVDDTKLRFFSKESGKNDSYEIFIKKGSVLKFN
ncbi:hypothetical protein [Atopomonas sediminilitoris]|uniref:hypothetical protein n=1 Tax=Atopomonas sediminilitoris TaxID=2919919 RepID=UPI001F4EF0EC|nr:hypothetical protein [Atopomonas sediminilitoris]MCJ8170920.1 hypothetical protein [Atopomonas sediminilitoris]